MTNEADLPSIPETEDSNDLSEVARGLENNLFDRIQSLAENYPDPLAPVAEHLAHTLAWGRARADAEEIAAIHERNADEREAS